MKKNKQFILPLIVIVTMSFLRCDDFLEQDISNDVITLIAPATGMETTNQRINFSWSSVKGATIYFFEVGTPAFHKPFELIVDSILTDTIQIIPKVTIALSPGIYEWRVKAANSVYETAYSDANTFVINEEPAE